MCHFRSSLECDGRESEGGREEVQRDRPGVHGPERPQEEGSLRQWTGLGGYGESRLQRYVALACSSTNYFDGW